MTGYRNFNQIVQARTAQTPGRAALVLLPGDSAGARAPRPPEPVSYRVLDAEARRLAGWLQDRGAAGERVLLLHGSRRQFAVSFLACLYAGAVAVPAPPPNGRAHLDQRIAGIVKDAAPCITLTDADQAPEVSQLLARSGFGGIPCLAADAVPAAAPWREPDLDESAPAYLQYTSGSTGAPRGVLATHGSVLANMRAINRALRTLPGSRLGGWLPFHHDMGLVGQLLHPLWLGGSSILLAPETFVRRPASWLEAVSQHDIAVSGAPDFAYDLCTRRVTDAELTGLDLSGWATAVSGGEPVRAETRRAFTERFACVGLRPEAFSPCYGLAEATLLVSGRAEGDPATDRTVDAAALERHRLRPPRPHAPARTLLSCGRPTAGELVIVDPESRAVLPEGRIGEIWLRGDSVAGGYWKRIGETAETFGVSAADGTGGYLRTGDLGTLEDGELYVTGRLKDLIITAGRNLYPHDLERAVQQVSGLFGSATAFGVAGERERVVVVQELRARSRYEVDFAGLAAGVVRCLSEEFDVNAGGVLLVRPGTVRRTTSGKVERAAMRDLFLRGELKPLHQEIDPELGRLVGSGGRP
ncbi:fatty acyl-AMP ligase [Streptomyces sparsus]